jgi:hypothetical protein
MGKTPRAEYIGGGTATPSRRGAKANYKKEEEREKKGKSNSNWLQVS